MGGAFIGLSDDATASFSNPAGLAFLSDTAVTIEYRDRTLDERRAEIEGNFNTQVFQEGERIRNAAFFSLNFRLGRWYFGLFQYEYLNERQSREFSSRSFGQEQSVENRTVSLDLRGNTRGIGVAHRLGDWKVGITFNQLDLEGRTQYERETFVRSIPPRIETYFSSIEDRDEAFGFNLGILHNPSDTFSWGLVWRDNPGLALETQVIETLNQQPFRNELLKVPFRVPDVFGAGILYRPRPFLSFLLDWQRIFYSQIIDQGFLIVESPATETKENYAISDINEIHLGCEWLVAGQQSVWAFRAGYYRNPVHTVTYSGESDIIDARFQSPGLEDQDHFTVGVGWVFRNRFEVDVAANMWSEGHEFTASLIWRKK